jgi:hypothetical protein
VFLDVFLDVFANWPDIVLMYHTKGGMRCIIWNMIDIGNMIDIIMEYG